MRSNALAGYQPLRSPRALVPWLAAAALLVLGPAAPGQSAQQGPAPRGQAAAAPATVTLEQAVRQAVQGDALEVARLQLASARVAFERAMADNLLSGSPLNEQVARNDLRKAENDFRDSHFQVVSAVVSAYFGVMKAAEAVQVAELQRQIAQAALEAAQQKARGGMLGQLDLEDARHSAQSAEQDLAEARIALDEAIAQLASALGYPKSVPGPDALAVPDPLPPLPDLDAQKAVDTALQKSGQIAWYAEAADIARKQLQQAVAEQAAALDVQARQHAVQSAELQLRQARLDLERSVRSALARASAAARRLEVAAASMRLEQQRLDAVRQQQKAGLKTDQAVMQAEVAARQARQSYLTAVQNYLTDLLELRRLLGEDPGLGPTTAEAMGQAAREEASSAR
ncbi:MAG TPA: TolC family protein [Limnochordales bacterium]